MAKVVLVVDDQRAPPSVMDRIRAYAQFVATQQPLGFYVVDKDSVGETNVLLSALGVGERVRGCLNDMPVKEETR